jgi:drug/metabolite transporter (DMT)-like permease
MSDLIARGPRNPSRLIFVATALVGAATGFATGDFGLFCLAVLGCAILLSVSYALVRRWLGWEPLKVDDLFEVVRLLSPH